ncbi:MAG: hypothetical protein J1E34_08985 [Oscillospiraceae bacterium]|nr:hypothetical protein [Oscillospiraceae bacterium]
MKSKTIKGVICAALACVFYLFEDFFTSRSILPLAIIAYLLFSAAFGFQIFLLSDGFKKIGKKIKLIIGLCGGIIALLTVGIIIGAVYSDGDFSHSSLKLVRAILFTLFGAVTAALLFREPEEKGKLTRRIWGAALCAVIVFSSVTPYATRPFSNWIDDLSNNYSFTVSPSDEEYILPNVKSNINRYGGRFSEDPIINEENNPYEFIDYIQLMECSGGNPERDLFIDPDDYSVLDDYDFSALLASCKGILKTGAKPLLKLGNVPTKLSQNILKEYEYDGGFDVNVYPPDDYEQYYNYIKAIADALVKEFGLEEVRSWRFGVLTEFENSDWFHAPGNDPEESKIEYCKLYDYTVQALIDVIGPDVFVGAHSMAVSEGLWDETEFIRHCGEGTNYATGEKGSRICYISASYYEIRPGKFGVNQSPLPVIMEKLRGAAESVGLTDLIYGIDEGRILCGNTSGRDSNQLNSRTVGYTYQAAFDARLIKQMFDTGMDYFSSWEYCSEPSNHGIPLITYHVALLASRFEGAKLLKTENIRNGHIYGADVNVSAGYNSETETLHVMAYNYKNSLKYISNADISIEIDASQFSDGEVNVTAYRIDDNCNWFDEWQEDRKELGITDDMFTWSPDDGCMLWADDEAKEKFRSLSDKYAECALLIPETFTAKVENGTLTLGVNLEANTVIFYEITKK